MCTTPPPPRPPPVCLLFYAFTPFAPLCVRRMCCRGPFSSSPPGWGTFRTWRRPPVPRRPTLPHARHQTPQPRQCAPPARGSRGEGGVGGVVRVGRVNTWSRGRTCHVRGGRAISCGRMRGMRVSCMVLRGVCYAPHGEVYIFRANV